MDANLDTGGGSGRQLNLPHGLVIFGKESLQFLRQATWEEWQQVMEYLCYCRKTSLRWIADARRTGRMEFGDEAVERYEEQLELDLPDLKAAEALERLKVRTAALSDAHHCLVAKRVDDPQKQKEWLELAEQEELSPRELATSISCGRIVRASEQSERKAGITTIEGVRGMFDIWAARTKDSWKQWPREKQALLLEEIQPIGEVWQWLRERLGR